MMTQTERSLSDMVKLMRQKADLMEKNNKLLKEQNEILRELIKKREGGYYYSVTKSTVAEEEDNDGRDICDACGHKDTLEYCMHCENGTMWIPKEEKDGRE